MPIDPSIALGVRPPQVADPLESYAKLMQLQGMQQQRAIQKESLGALAEERKAKAQAAKQAGQDVAALDQAYQPGLTREQVIDRVPGHMKAVVGKHWDEADAAGLKAREARAKADEADTDYAASLAVGVKPWLSMGPEQAMGATRIALDHAKAQGHDVSAIEQHLQQNPESLPQILDSLIARSPKYSELQLKATGKPGEGQHVLNEGAVLVGADGKVIAKGNPKTEKPSGKWTPDYDAEGKPIDRWVADGPGATAPRQEAPVAAPRPLVLGQGARAVDPTTGALIAEGAAPPAPRTAAPARVDTVNEAGQPVTKFVEPTAGQEFIKQPEPEKITRPREVKPGSEEAFFIAFAKKLGKRPDDLTLDEMAKARQAWSRADDKPTVSKDNPLWVWRDGKPVRTTNSEVQPGDSPTKPEGVEKKRAVTAGDAGKLADYNTSLNELKAVRGELTSAGAATQTGYAAKAGAMAPNIVTELTGFGADAKAKQATIDRVKQVIGKTLEGGVLRKEDEVKYEKILPTIGDPPAIVAAKLNGLERAVTQRKQEHLDSLADAGYDVSRYLARTPTAAPAPKVGDKVGRFEIVGVK